MMLRGVLDSQNSSDDDGRDGMGKVDLFGRPIPTRFQLILEFLALPLLLPYAAMIWCMPAPAA